MLYHKYWKAVLSTTGDAICWVDTLNRAFTDGIHLNRSSNSKDTTLDGWRLW